MCSHGTPCIKHILQFQTYIWSGWEYTTSHVPMAPTCVKHTLHFQTYMWGGGVYNIPCSHGAHLEKESKRNYRHNMGHIYHLNYKRIVEVWLDDYHKEIFYYFNPDIKVIIAITSHLIVKYRCAGNTRRTHYEQIIFREKTQVPNRS